MLSGRILPPCLGCELLKAEPLASLLWVPGTLPGPAECLTTGADLVSSLVSSKVVFLSCRGSGAPDSPDGSEVVEVGRQECMGKKEESLYLPGAVAPKVSTKSVLVGPCSHQSSGLAGLTHVADEELPDF